MGQRILDRSEREAERAAIITSGLFFHEVAVYSPNFDELERARLNP